MNEQMTFKLNNGVVMPMAGIGTFLLSPDEAAGILTAGGKAVVDFILALGGGSTIDCCKIVAAQAMQVADIWTTEMEKRDMPSASSPWGPSSPSPAPAAR